MCFNGDILLINLNGGKIIILENCEKKVSNEEQKICVGWKEQLRKNKLAYVQCVKAVIEVG